MTIKDLLENYKGDIEVVVKQIEEDEAVEVVSFNVAEKDAIKDEIMNSEISKWNVEVNSKFTTAVKIVVLFRAAVATEPNEDVTTDPVG